MSAGQRPQWSRVVSLLLAASVLTVFSACLGNKQGKGRVANESQSGEEGFTNWFGTSVTPQTRDVAATNAPVPGVAPDNTAQNKKETDGNTLTPLDQGSGPADRGITQQLRRAIVTSSDFSFSAKNIKIITINGSVTLRGVVKNEGEKKQIEALAKQIPGVEHLEDQLEVAGSK